MKRSGWTALFTQDPSIAHYRRGMRQPLLLLCSLALCAPACMAQSLPPAAGDDSQVARAAASADVPRSAMGRVMGIMIEALRQEAKRLTLPSEMGERFQVMGFQRDVEFGVAFMAGDLSYRL